MAHRPGGAAARGLHRRRRGGRGAGDRLPVRPVHLRRRAGAAAAGRAVPRPAGLADDGLAQLGARGAAGRPPGRAGARRGRGVRRVGRRPRSADGPGRLLDLGAPAARSARYRHRAADQPGGLAAGRAADHGVAGGAGRPDRHRAAHRRRRAAARPGLDDAGRGARARRLARPARLGGVGCRARRPGARRARRPAPGAGVSGLVVRLLAGAAVAGALHAALNTALLRRPPAVPPPVDRPVTVVLPVRDEEGEVGACLAAVLDQRGVPGLRVVVVDDGSTDGTREEVQAVADSRVTVLEAGEPPPGWLGKPHACAVGAARAGDDDGVLVFVDADVRLWPDAIAAAVAVLDAHRLDLVSPWPRPLTGGVAERLVQPLSPWLWATTLPLRLAERSPRPSLAAANGQFLVVRAQTYRRAGGAPGGGGGRGGGPA